jgi:hypothetical protein
MITHLYRFRPANAILDGYKELAKQGIYFAAPEKLNDPMEGYRDVFWSGDPIVWRNLIRHYLLCLTQIYSETYPEIDFFNSIGRLPIPILNAVSYAGENGELSTCRAARSGDKHRRLEAELSGGFPDRSDLQNIRVGARPGTQASALVKPSQLPGQSFEEAALQFRRLDRHHLRHPLHCHTIMVHNENSQGANALIYKG